jgi:hypothetical protein
MEGLSLLYHHFLTHQEKRNTALKCWQSQCGKVDDVHDWMSGWQEGWGDKDVGK